MRLLNFWFEVIMQTNLLTVTFSNSIAHDMSQVIAEKLYLAVVMVWFQILAVLQFFLCLPILAVPPF